MTGKVLQSDKQVHLKKVLRDNIEYRSHARWDGQTPPRLAHAAPRPRLVVLFRLPRGL